MGTEGTSKATREFELAATEIISELGGASIVAERLTYGQLHAIVAYAYGRGNVAGLQWSMEKNEEAIERVRQELNDGGAS